MTAIEVGVRDKQTGEFAWPLCNAHSLRPCPYGCPLPRPVDGPRSLRGKSDTEIHGRHMHAFGPSEVAHLKRHGIL